MKIENPHVTLADDARAGVEEQVRSGFLDWLHQCSVTGDDGELYFDDEQGVECEKKFNTL